MEEKKTFPNSFNEANIVLISKPENNNVRKENLNSISLFKKDAKPQVYISKPNPRRYENSIRHD